jgi:hypothetical protein
MTTSQVTGDRRRAAWSEIYSTLRKTKLHRVGQAFTPAQQEFKVLKYSHNQTASLRMVHGGIWLGESEATPRLIAGIRDKKRILLIGDW